MNDESKLIAQRRAMLAEEQEANMYLRSQVGKMQELIFQFTKQMVKLRKEVHTFHENMDQRERMNFF